jgi:hypothetical protein
LFVERSAIETARRLALSPAFLPGGVIAGELLSAFLCAETVHVADDRFPMPRQSRRDRFGDIPIVRVGPIRAQRAGLRLAEDPKGARSANCWLYSRMLLRMGSLGSVTTQAVLSPSMSPTVSRTGQI